MHIVEILDVLKQDLVCLTKAIEIIESHAGHAWLALLGPEAEDRGIEAMIREIERADKKVLEAISQALEDDLAGRHDDDVAASQAAAGNAYPLEALEHLQDEIPGVMQDMDVGGGQVS